MRKSFVLLIILCLLSACSGEGGYCVKDCNIVGEDAVGNPISECSPPTCYDLNGNLK